MIVGLLMYGMTIEELDPLAVFFLVIGAADKPWLGSGQELGITFIGPPSGVMAASGGSRTWYFPLDFFHKLLSVSLTVVFVAVMECHGQSDSFISFQAQKTEGFG